MHRDMTFRTRDLWDEALNEDRYMDVNEGYRNEEAETAHTELFLRNVVAIVVMLVLVALNAVAIYIAVKQGLEAVPDKSTMIWVAMAIDIALILAFAIIALVHKENLFMVQILLSTRLLIVFQSRLYSSYIDSHSFVNILVSILGMAIATVGLLLLGTLGLLFPVGLGQNSLNGQPQDVEGVELQNDEEMRNQRLVDPDPPDRDMPGGQNGYGPINVD